jgi:tetratricopeptide (TPR) repeat protein
MKQENDEKRIYQTPLVHILCLLLIGIFCYANTFHVPFYLDDSANIIDNPLIRDVSLFLEPSRAAELSLPENVEVSHRRRLIGYFTFAMNYRLHGLSLSGYHVTNMVIHLFSGLLVYVLTTITLRTVFTRKPEERHVPLGALLCSALFLVHPVQTQAVTYIVQRFASLAAFFYLLSLVCYAEARVCEAKVRRVGFYTGALLSAALALKTKENAFTLPVIMALYEFFFMKGKVRERVVFLAPLLLLVALVVLATLRGGGFAVHTSGEQHMLLSLSSDLGRLEYLFTQFRVIVTYLRLLVLPVNLNLDYAYPVYRTLLHAHVLVSLLVLVTAFGLALFAGIRSRAGSDRSLRVVSFGVFWFFIALSVESSVFPIADVIFEHRVYLPSVGFFMAFSPLVVVAAVKLRRRFMKVSTIAVVMVVVVFAGLTVTRNSLWGNELSLWRDIVMKAPGNPRAHNNLGTAYRRAGNLKRATEAWEKAASLDASYPDPLKNLGNVYYMYGDYAKAHGFYSRFFRLGGDNYETFYNMALVSERLGYRADAVRYLERFIGEAPPELEDLVSQAKMKIDELRGGTR